MLTPLVNFIAETANALLSNRYIETAEICWALLECLGWQSSLGFSIYPAFFLQLLQDNAMRDFLLMLTKNGLQQEENQLFEFIIQVDYFKIRAALDRRSTLSKKTKKIPLRLQIMIGIRIHLLIIELTVCMFDDTPTYFSVCSKSATRSVWRIQVDRKSVRAGNVAWQRFHALIAAAKL